MNVTDLRKSLIAGAFLFVAACASSGPAPDLAAAEVAALDSARAREVEYQTEISRLKSENARLARKVLEMQRDKDAAEAASDQAAAADAAAADAAPLVSLPPAPAVRDAYAGDVLIERAAPETIAEADVPIQPAPRLTQPTFASTEAVFENDAEGDIAMSSVIFGVHLASYRGADEAREGWKKLQRENPDELGLLEARIETIELPDRGVFLRLIGGGVASAEKANALCASLKSKGLYCAVSSFEGEKLSLSSEG